MVKTIQVRDGLKVELDELKIQLGVHSVSDVIEIALKALRLVKAIDPSLSVLQMPESKAIEELKRRLCGQQSTTPQTPQVIVMPMPWMQMPMPYTTQQTIQQTTQEIERMVISLKNELEAMIRGYISRELEKLKAEVKKVQTTQASTEASRAQVVFVQSPQTTTTTTTTTSTTQSTTTTSITSSDDLPDWVKDNPWVSVIKTRHS